MIRDEIDRDGFAIVEGVLSVEEVGRLTEILNRQKEAAPLVRRRTVFAARNLLDIPEIAVLADSTPVRSLVQLVLGESFFPVRGILFDKIPEANWKVPWHQDVTIAVKERIEIEGFGPWSTKAGILHVQPPASVLEKMISIRLHLDACDEANGALRVIPRSHTIGRAPEDRIPDILKSSSERVCSVAMGGALLMRPLLLHTSSPAVKPAHRRVIHLDFATEALPGQLMWLSETAVRRGRSQRV